MEKSAECIYICMQNTLLKFHVDIGIELFVTLSTVMSLVKQFSSCHKF